MSARLTRIRPQLISMTIISRGQNTGKIRTTDGIRQGDWMRWEKEREKGKD